MNKNNQQTEIIRRIEQAEDWRKTNYETLWRSYYRQFRSRGQQKKEGSNLFIPYSYMICETVRARLAESLFASRPYVNVRARENGDAEQADRAQILIDWQLSDRMHLATTIKEDFLQNLCVFGTGIMFTTWSKKSRKIRRMRSRQTNISYADGTPVLAEDGIPVTVTLREPEESERSYYDDPQCVSIDVFDFFVDPAAKNIDDARYCGHREYKSRRSLEQLIQTAGWKIDFSTLSHSENPEDGRRLRMEENGKAKDEPDNDNGLYLVHHYWEDERHVVVIERQQIALDEANPFWHGRKPYDKATYAPIANSFYGIGLCEMLQGLQEELNTTRNMRIDYYAAALRRMWKMRKGCGLTPRDLAWRQNGVIQVENMDDLQEINVQDLPASAFAVEEGIKTDMKDVSGCHDIIMGLAGSNETATTTMTKDNNASIRFKDVVEAVANDILVPVAEKCISMDGQFLTEERSVRLIGSSISTIVAPEDFDGDYDLIYTGSAVDPMANQELNKEKITNAYGMLSGDQLYAADPEAKIRFMDELLKVLGVENRESILPALPQTEPSDSSAFEPLQVISQGGGEMI